MVPFFEPQRQGDGNECEAGRAKSAIGFFCIEGNPTCCFCFTRPPIYNLMSRTLCSLFSNPSRGPSICLFWTSSADRFNGPHQQSAAGETQRPLFRVPVDSIGKVNRTLGEMFDSDAKDRPAIARATACVQSGGRCQLTVCCV